MIDKEQFGKRIVLLRKKSGLSQAELAEKLNISPQAVSKWECGQTLPDLDLLVDLSWLFDISINGLLEDNCSFTDKISENAMLPDEISSLIKNKAQRKLISSISGFFNQPELREIAAELVNGSLDLSLAVEAKDKKNEYNSSAKIPIDILSEKTLKELSPAIAETLYDSVGAADRGIKRISDILSCPVCKKKLKLNADSKKFNCENGHSYQIDDGVIYFNTREIPGEQWSLTYRNYNHYIEEATYPELPVYTRGEIFSEEVKWREIEKRRPRMILDIASGTGSGIKYALKRINWNCTVILTDLSHRILAWDRKFITENINNPYVDMVYIACDCANIPLADNSVDCVTSRCGFESMQNKTMQGFGEAYRILKKGGNAIYDKAVIDDRSSLNTKKWLMLMDTLTDCEDADIAEKMLEIADWQQKCAETGYKKTEAIKIYNELPAPETDTFPYENQILRWMDLYVCISEK